MTNEDQNLKRLLSSGEKVDKSSICAALSLDLYKVRYVVPEKKKRAVRKVKVPVLQERLHPLPTSDLQEHWKIFEMAFLTFCELDYFIAWKILADFNKFSLIIQKINKKPTINEETSMDWVPDKNRADKAAITHPNNGKDIPH